MARVVNRYEYRQSKKVMRGAPWGIIFISFIFIIPLGIYLMMSKLHNDIENMESNARKTAFVGWLLIGLAIMGAYVGVNANGENVDINRLLVPLVLYVLLLIGGGWAIIRNARKYQIIGLKYNRYMPVLRNSPDGKLDNIATKVDRTYEDVYRDLQILIHMNLLPDTYIDEPERMLVGPMFRKPTPDLTHQSMQINPSMQIKPRAVKCLNCGGITEVKTEYGKCEYCGSPLKLE